MVLFARKEDTWQEMISLRQRRCNSTRLSTRVHKRGPRSAVSANSRSPRPTIRSTQGSFAISATAESRSLQRGDRNLGALSQPPPWVSWPAWPGRRFGMPSEGPRDFEIGLIAIVVGLMVGVAVRKGSKGRGGWFYQTLAVVLTYGCICAQYMPDIVQGFVQHVRESKAAQAQAAAKPPVGKPDVKKPGEKCAGGKGGAPGCRRTQARDRRVSASPCRPFGRRVRLFAGGAVPGWGRRTSSAC